MTREEILALPAGRELDALVAEKVMTHIPPHPTGCVPAYSTHIGAAWVVFQDCHDWVFSERQVFLHELARLLQGEPRAGYVTAWPDALFQLSPETICRAALLAVLQCGEPRRRTRFEEKLLALMPPPDR